MDGKGKKEWNTDCRLPPDCREIAYSTDRRIFLATGVKNLKPCANEARRTGPIFLPICSTVHIGNFIFRFVVEEVP